MSSALPLTLDVSGMVGHWVWKQPRGVLPAGVLIDHGDHQMLVAWASYAEGPVVTVTLDSLQPLTVLESLRCNICGSTGRIEAGAWLPTKGGGS